MATQADLRAALDDYVDQARKSERVVKALRGWNCVIAIEALDIGAAFTMTIRDATTEVADGAPATADLIVRGKSEDLANIFWCDENPASNYMQGAIKIQGSQDDTMRLDAMALMIYLETQQSQGKP